MGLAGWWSVTVMVGGRRVPLLYQNSSCVRQEQIVLFLMRGAINFGACYLLPHHGPYYHDLQCGDQR